ncbi:hypothetical protein EIN_490550 [Entamoeba invadens IP1]|uniref:TLDc domain-containing protein n=1 Tax=Entamoeba invadens IP1 TaxID=370355 RepID=A0A0A1U7D5_ENTIV|nr:hypothetical protein EIN_490550 [Entamoeba invadens IP1]ELP88946.1 hypothetical protein EIN_490550 [Entamoeba invadens IP1]|eukprot:XP_004255717.1 hypothetical protein EIN_490550 [Entamoeba invadens IP1]
MTENTLSRITEDDLNKVNELLNGINENEQYNEVFHIFSKYLNDLLSRVVYIEKVIEKKLLKTNLEMKPIPSDRGMQSVSPHFNKSMGEIPYCQVTPLLAQATYVPPRHSDKFVGPMRSRSTNNTMTSAYEIESLMILEKHKETLRSWSEKRSFRVIYDSTIDSFNSTTFNAQVVGLNNVMVLVFDSKENVFGGYTEKCIPVCGKDEYKYIENDQKFFVFSLENHQSADSIKIERKNSELGFRMSNDGNCVFGIANFFSVFKTRQGYIHPTFKKYYTTDKEAILFNKTVFPERFVIKAFIAVQWI